MKKIVVGTDFSEHATAALRFAATIAASTGAELIVVYADPFEPPLEFTVTETPHLMETLNDSKRQAKMELTRYVTGAIPAGVEWRAIVAEGFPAVAINEVAEAEHADLIAVGTHGRSGLRRLLLGSVAEEVMRTANVPVLTVRTADIAVEPALPYT